jgi:hypothetical protein
VSGRAAHRVPERLHELVAGLRDMADELHGLASNIAASTAPSPSAEQFLSLNDLCARIPYKEQTIRNLMGMGQLRKGVHFEQRRRHGKIVFIWSAMERWLCERQLDRSIVEPFIPTHNARTRKIR